MAEHNTRFDCDALQKLLTRKHTTTVTHWRGREAVSQPYRFEITLAVPHDELDPQHPELPIELLLDQAATLRTRKPDGQDMCWHGVITEAAQAGSGEVHDYYTFVLEPRLARLRYWQWSDVYVGKTLSEIIKQIINEAGLAKEYSPNNAYDYWIKAIVPPKTKKEFVCQFEESCLDFLMRLLEHYGVYFWFEQDQDQEAIVFADNVDQQPQNIIEAVYYPKGEIDPDAREIALVRMDRQIRAHPKSVTLHASPVYGNTTRKLVHTEDSPMPADAVGPWHSYEDHFEIVDATNAAPQDTVTAKKLATWRAQEQLCDSLHMNGEARTPGLAPGHFLASHLYRRGARASDYYVVQIEHEGYNPRRHASRSDEPPYRGRFVAVPRWQDPAEKKTPLQYRPPRVTPVPRIARMVNGFVDIGDEKKPMRYAQMDELGRYKVRFCFPRKLYTGTNNSAWLRMATPYAGGASSTDLKLKPAGQHFPLREGTEVLISFINGDPDRPVIVAALPNSEAPSVVTSKNASEHLLQTPSGNVLALRDNLLRPPAANPESKSTLPFNKDVPQLDASNPSIRLYSPTANSYLTLGATKKEENNGFELKTDGRGEIVAQGSMLVEVPGHLRLAAGGGSLLNNFLSSRVQGMPPGMSLATSGGMVMEHFLGAKFEFVEAIKFSHFFGAKVDLSEALSFTSNIAAGFKFEATKIKVLGNSKEVAYKDHTMLFGKATYEGTSWDLSCVNRSELLTTSKTKALGSISVDSDSKVSLQGGTSNMELTLGRATLSGDQTSVKATTDTKVTGNVSATLSSGRSKVEASAIDGVWIDSPVEIDITSRVDISIDAPQVYIKGKRVNIA
ncbi:type VI secretion system Vgr family protein [Candidimonas nitroreducens]|uniref:Gp5/Type VI secretion system Vgr protein OB-fold domain-containing protein n=1 Tax=Candidimonas nitroreducens TaxID=683354 RepID=A0A225MCV2_9BURK|nr:type VI secretion system tip protein TssI/VgrG [Candidimonas nitroreducens]OWT59097.1 hypothetical protein CEY11_12985 [Candidimonas nitroreducens]